MRERKDGEAGTRGGGRMGEHDGGSGVVAAQDDCQEQMERGLGRCAGNGVVRGLRRGRHGLGRGAGETEEGLLCGGELISSE